MTTPSTGGYRPGGFDLDNYLAAEETKQKREDQAATGPSSVNYAWNQGQATYVPPDYNGSPQVPVQAGIPGLPPIYSTSAYANIGQTQWAPKSVVQAPLFFGGGYFTGGAGNAYALELERAARTIHPNSTGNSLWEIAVNQSEWLAASGQEIVTPYELIRQYFESGGGVYDAARGNTDGGSSYSGYSGGGGGYSSGGGGGGQVRLTDPTSARGLLLQTMQGVLGRNPSEREYKQFLATLNESEMANPQTVSVEGDNAVYSGGTDPSVLAMEFAQDAEDYKERQGDMYFQTFMRSLAGGV